MTTFDKATLFLVAAFTFSPAFTLADVHVCMEKGTRVISSMPCSGAGSTVETFRSPPQMPIAAPKKPTNQISQFQGTGSPTFRNVPNQQNQPQRLQQERYPEQQNSNRGMVVGNRLDGAILPGQDGGMIHGGRFSGTILPGREGGMVHGGPLSGTFWPGEAGGMIHGGPMSGSIIPGAQGGMIHGGPMSGTILPPR